MLGIQHKIIIFQGKIFVNNCLVGAIFIQDLQLSFATAETIAVQMYSTLVCSQQDFIFSMQHLG
jgi:hypothetical protein